MKFTKTVYVCDRCKKEFDHSLQNLILPAIDHTGIASKGKLTVSSIKADLCDDCAGTYYDTIRSTFGEISTSDGKTIKISECDPPESARVFWAKFVQRHKEGIKVGNKYADSISK